MRNMWWTIVGQLISTHSRTLRNTSSRLVHETHAFAVLLASLSLLAALRRALALLL